MKTRTFSYSAAADNQIPSFENESSMPRIDEVTAPASRRTGKVSAIVRLVVAALTVVIGTVALLITLFSGGSNASSPLADAIASEGAIFLLACMLWCLIKWCVFLFPKTLSWANGMWRAWHPFTPFGWIVKVMLWIYILFLPTALSGLITTPFITACSMLLGNLNIATAGVFFLLFGGLLAFLVALDVAKVKNCTLKELLRAIKPCEAEQA